jgi:heterodisulfide reductase subunit B
MRLSYYPGCTLKTTAENFDRSALESAKVLGVELVELPRWNCCGTVHALAKDDVIHHLAPIRNLIRVEELASEGLVDGSQVVTLCAMCYNTLKRANVVVKEDAEKMQKVRDIMEREKPYSGKVKVLHLLEVLRDLGWNEIAGHIKRPLRGLKVAPYYGCLLLRPRDFSIDDTDNPQIMEMLIEALGADLIDIPFKLKCCGAYHAVQLKEVVAELSHRILDQASKAGADMVVTACPLCEFNLGPRQGEIKKIYREFDSIPVVYFTQLMALAFGVEEAAGFERNSPDPRPVLIDKGLLLEES